MGKLTYGMNVSVDGYIADTNGDPASILIVDRVCVLSEALANTLMQEHVAREVRTVANRDAAVSILPHLTFPAHQPGSAFSTASRDP